MLDRKNRRALMLGLAPALLIGLSLETVAAPGDISQSPLYLTTGVQPNIFLMIDDSGSMYWEALLPSVSQGVDGITTLDLTPDTDKERIHMCAGYNVMAYNPAREYTPWIGVDNAGVSYKDQSLSSARTNPFLTTTANISTSVYYVWTDADGDGSFDTGECGETSSTNGIAVSTLPAAQQTNFANWYSYYRKREYVAKRALSQILYGATSRVGLGTLHNNNSVGTPIEDMTDTNNSPTKKEILMRNLFRIQSQNGTPLRLALNYSGTYYESGIGSPLFSSNQPSPILPAGSGGECQQNFTIMMSDGYWNGSSPNVGNTDGLYAASPPQFGGNTLWDGGSYADTYSSTLADVAMRYYERDLRPAYADKVPIVPGVDSNKTQHMVTFTVAFGLNGTLSANPPDTISPFTWPQPVQNTSTTVDDMRHAAWNGRGQFLSAGNPKILVDSLNAAIQNISDRSGTAAAVSFNSTSLQTDTLVYQSRFDARGWHGDLLALEVDFLTTPPTISNAWDPTAGSTLGAARLLDARSFNTRDIVTFDPSQGTNGAGVLFDWANLTTTQKADLCALGRDWTVLPTVQWLPGWLTGCTAADVTTNTVNAVKLVDYMKGDHSNEGIGPNQFRGRNGHKLGDIVHSGPTYVGPPNARYPNLIEGVGNEYFTFVNDHNGINGSTREGMVYVGSNDGMLHAFKSCENIGNACSGAGEEVFAYIPNLVYSDKKEEGLHYLAEQTKPNTYGHRYYVDLSATSADAFINNSWKTLLLGGLRGGGKGIFALDITDPSSVGFATAAPLWEFTHNDLGFTFSEIRIARMNNGKWAAIFGNGYNSDPLGDGKAKLFIVYLDGSNLANPIIIDTGVGSMVNNDCSDANSDCNGLSSPAVADLNADGSIDRAYAGDLHGNMWAFDLTDSSATPSWRVAHGAVTPAPLFTACRTSPCTLAGRQPITTKPALARHRTQRSHVTEPNLMVFFGSGQYLAIGDNYTTNQQTFYGVWDSGRSNGNLDRANLVEQTLGTDTTTVAGNTVSVRTINTTPATSVDYITTPEYGWYIDLPTTRERVAVTPHAIGKFVFFNTMIPSTNVCDAGGTGWLMSVSQFDGTDATFPIIDLNADGNFDSNDYVNSATPVGLQINSIPTESRFIGDKRVTATSLGDVRFDNIQALPPSPPSWMSWSDLPY